MTSTKQEGTQVPNNMQQLIEEVVGRYERIFKGTTMWKEQKSFLIEELSTIASKSAEEATFNQKAFEVGLKNFRRLRLIDHEPLMDEAPPAETVLSVLKSGLGGMFDDQAVSYIYEKAIRYYLKALSQKESQ